MRYTCLEACHGHDGQCSTTQQEAAMRSPKGSESFRLRLTKEQKVAIKRVIGRDGEELELQVSELEERIVPRLAANHNEFMLVDD